MFISILRDVLNGNRLAQVSSLIARAEFVDGKISGGTDRDKNNLELSPETDHYVEVLNIVERAVRESVEFNLTAFPRAMTRPIISRYEKGMYYHEHVDMPVMGFMSTNGSSARGLSPVGANYVRSDLSMTLFLTSPDSYDGGELCFEGASGATRTKLPPGSAILYPTGARHSVAEVTRGVRLAAVFWIQTLFPVEAHRRAVWDANKLTSILEKDRNSPEYALSRECFFNLCRIFANV
jgi:PKHD-type hydroxylase